MNDSPAGAPAAAMPLRAGDDTLDIGQMLDRGRFSRLQKSVVVLAAVSIVLDGFNGQLIGFAIPALIQQWGLSRAAFAPTVAAGLIGMGIGSFSAGLFADRFGRRRALIASVVLFGTATGAVGAAPDLLALAALRFIAGLGIGGALPIATTLTAEFTPARRRTLAVTATIVCVPLGGMLAGLFAAAVLPAWGWRGLFLIGGVFPILLAVVLWHQLPESPRFLARRPSRWPELGRLLQRMGWTAVRDAQYRDGSGQAHAAAGFAALFEAGQARDTIAIWCAFFMCLLAVYSAFSWLPAMLSAQGVSSVLAAAGLTAYNLGGVVGAFLCAAAIVRFGSRWPLVLGCAGAAVSAFMISGLSVLRNTGLLLVGVGIHGLFVNAVQSTMFALCAYVYPTSIRATGTSSALAFGRIGAILSSFAGAAVISAAGASGYLAMLGAAMVVVLIALLAVQRHIPAQRPSMPATTGAIADRRGG